MQQTLRHAQIPTLPVLTRVVLFTIGERALNVLLVARDGNWALPGAYLVRQEAPARCAARALREQAGITGAYLEQLYTFGRHPHGGVTVAYYAAAPTARFHPAPAPRTGEGRWFALGDLPPVSRPEREVITTAHRRLAGKLDYSTIAFQFMPEKFTLSELQSVYEIILQARLDKRNFRKRMLALGRIEETGEFIRNGSHRPARLYRLKYPDRVEIIK